MGIVVAFLVFVLHGAFDAGYKSEVEAYQSSQHQADSK